MADYTVNAVFSADIKDFQKNLNTAIENVKKVQEAFKNGDFEATGKITVESKDATKEIENVKNGLKKVDKSEAEVEVSADTKEAQSDLRDVSKDLKSVDGSTAEVEVEADAKSAEGEISSVASEVQSLDGQEAEIIVEGDSSPAVSAVAEASSELGGIDGMEAETVVTCDTSQASSEVQSMIEQMQQYKQSAQDTFDESGKSSDSFGSKIGELASSLMDTSGEFDIVGAAAEGFGIKLGMNVGDMVSDCVSKIGELVNSCIDLGMQFDSTMSNVKAIGGATDDEFDALVDKAQEMGKTTVFSASEAGDALSYMAMAGWSTDDMLNSLQGVMNLAAAGGTDLATTSDILTDAMTAFGDAADGTTKVMKDGFEVEVSNAERYADVLAKTAASANTNVNMLGESFEYVAPVSGAMGYSLEDTSAALGLMANAGIKASQGGTSLKNILSNLAKPSKDVAAAMDALGISLEEYDEEANKMVAKDLGSVLENLREAFASSTMSAEEYNAAIANEQQCLAEGTITQKQYEKNVESLTDKYYSSEEALKAQYAATIAGEQGMSGLLAIVNSSDKDFQTLVNNINNSNGAAQEMADTMTDNLAGDMKMCQSATEALEYKISRLFNGPLRLLTQMKTAGITAITNAINGIGTAVSTVGTAFTTIFQPIIDGFSTWGTILEPVKEAFGNWGNSILQTFGLAGEGMNTFSGIFHAIFDPITELLQPIGQAISDIGTGIQTWLVDKVTLLQERFQPAFDAIAAGIEKIKPLFEALWTMFETWVNSPVGQAVVQLFQNLIGPAVQAMLTTFGTIFSTVFDTVVTSLSTAFTLIGDVFNIVIDLVTAVVQLFTGDFSGAFESLGDMLGNLGGLFTDAFTGVWTVVDEWIGNLVGLFDDFVENVFQIGGDVVSGLWNGISGKAAEIGENIKNFCGDVLNNIKGFFGIASPSTVMNEEVGQMLGQGLGEGLDDSQTDVDPSIESMCTHITDTLSSKWDGVKTAAKNLWNNLFGGGEDESSSSSETMTVNIDMSGAIEATETAMRTLRDNLKSQFASLQAELTAQNQGIATSVQQVFATMSQTALSIVAQMVTQMASTVSSMSGSFAGVFDSITGAATEKVQALYNSALTILNSLATSSVSTVKKMATKVADVFSYIQTQTVAISTTMSTQIMNITNSMTNSFLTAIKIFSTSLLNAFEAMRVKIVASMTNMMSQVIQVTAAMVSRVQSTASGLPSWFQSLGKAMMSSLSSGILSGLSSVNSAAGTIVTALVNTFKEGLGIHSPSDVAYWIGQMWLAGLIGGMSKDELIQFTAKYVEDMKTSFSNGDIQIGTMIDTLGIEGAKDLIDYLNRNGDVESVAQVATSFFPLPGSLSDYAITSVFGNRAAPTAGASTNHQGTDIGAASGTPIYAMADGTVSLASYYGGYGNAVMLDHGDGLQSLYGHMSSIATTAGKTVKAGELIGYVGSTGVSTGAHLHFETRQNGTAIDSYPYLGGAAVSSSPKTLAQAIENALTLKEGGTSSSAINAMKSNVTVGTVGSVNQSLWTGSGELIDWITEALQITGYYSAQNLANTVALAMGESGGNPNAINKWDSNWYAGTPSKGLLQTIDSTFQAYALPGHTNIYNPVDNAIASIRYQMDRYGYLRATPGYKIGSSYIPEDMLAMLHKGEVVLPVEDVARLQELANPSSPYQNSHGNILDTVLNLPGSRTGGSGVFDSSPTRQNQGKQDDMYITVVSELDGRVVGKSTAKYVESENEWRESRMNRIKGIR